MRTLIKDLKSISQEIDEKGDKKPARVSLHPCDCCGTTLGLMRFDVSALVRPWQKENTLILGLKACPECLTNWK